MKKTIILFSLIFITKIASCQTANAGNDQLICSDHTFLSANVAPEPYVGLWNIISGNAVFVNVNVPNTEVNEVSPGINIFEWSFLDTNGNIISSDTVIITNDSPTVPNAGVDMELCSDSATLSGINPLIGNGVWSILSGSAIFDDVTAYNSKVWNLSKGQNIFRWTITNKNCVLYDEVIISNNLPAEPEASVEQDTVYFMDSIKIIGTVPIIGEGYWSIIMGSGIIVDVSGSTTHLINPGLGETTLRWTLQNNNCVLFDQVTFYVTDDSTYSKNYLEDSVNLIKHQNFKDKISIYPNPFYNSINISFCKSQWIKNIEFYNVSGQILRTFKISNEINSINLHLSDLPSGLYSIRINEKEYSYNRIIIKKL